MYQVVASLPRWKGLESRGRAPRQPRPAAKFLALSEKALSWPASSLPTSVRLIHSLIQHRRFLLEPSTSQPKAFLSQSKDAVFDQRKSTLCPEAKISR
jgi:hypothetical protein